jgi:hypothetical protein
MGYAVPDRNLNGMDEGEEITSEMRYKIADIRREQEQKSRPVGSAFWHSDY